MSAFTISDELRGILEDVAKSPKQRLFAGKFFSALHGAFAADIEPVGVARPGLSAAERELVRMHRRELSLCLLEGFYAHFFAPGGPSTTACASVEPKSDESRMGGARFSRDSAPAQAFKRGYVEMASQAP